MQEKEIRQLFRNERRANESLTPDFAVTLYAALSRRRARPRRLILRVAFGVVALVAIAGFVSLLAGRYPREQAPSLVAGPSESVTKPAAAPDEPASAPAQQPAKPARRANGRRQSTKHAAPLISQWRSPTEFLLKTPGDELLRTVPRLGASSVEIKLDLSSPRN
ncbi:MAG: hypothetical protein WAU45_05995 [Blastocatellia bacterium]